MKGALPIGARQLRLGMLVLVCGLGACVERQVSVVPLEAVLESSRPPIAVTARQQATADGRVAREVTVRAERGSEPWFGRAGRQLSLEADGRQVVLVGGAEGLVARWIGGPGTLTWTARDGSAGLRVELADLDKEPTRAPRFEPVAPTGLVEMAVPVGVAP